jgi:pimeloyl-ACP methyl ester carboxylesterase
LIYMASEQSLRTPDSRFAALPAFAYAPHYTQHLGLRVHHIDEGRVDAPVTVLCLHGNPTWSYLYRHMVPVFTAAGLRVVAPDLIGFGRSDKPLHESAHSFDFHRSMLLAFVEKLDLRNILLVVQDWGGILGLTLPMAMPERFTRLLVMNTTLATGAVTAGFEQWRSYSNSKPDLPVGQLLRRGKPSMTAAEAAGYDAPFVDASYKAALRAFPNLVPDVATQGAQAPGVATSQAAQHFWQHQWAGSSFMAVGTQDPVLGLPVMQQLQARIKGCPAPLLVPEGGHFVQEWGAPIAQAALQHFGLSATPLIR